MNNRFDHPGGDRSRDVLRRDAVVRDCRKEIKGEGPTMGQGKKRNNKLSAGDAFTEQADGTTTGESNPIPLSDRRTGQFAHCLT